MSIHPDSMLIKSVDNLCETAKQLFKTSLLNVQYKWAHRPFLKTDDLYCFTCLTQFC